MVNTVHVVFKTHLDLGFTDTAAHVTEQYIRSYIPAALQLSVDLERRDGAARFVWTTGSWLIHEALRNGSAEEVAALRAGIAAGHIAWHALPLTTHTEAMNEGLTEHAVRIGRALDAEFGRHTIAAKMTDVPGHTIGLVPVLARNDVQFLHLGVNGASAVPEVPEFFRWQAPDRSEVVVCYAQSYGATELGVAVAPGGEHALHLAHTGDNDGPPSLEEVETLFAALQAEYPGASVIASTLDAFAAAVLSHRDELPVVTSEIGDSWIHGLGSDPVQTSNLRALLRLRDAWIADGSLTPGTTECDDFSDGLLLVAEHTWGQDLKTYLPDYVNYRKPDFHRARERDLIDTTANPVSTAAYWWALEERAEPDGPRYSTFEASWAEQRGHMTRALSALTPERRSVAERVLLGSVPVGDEASGAPGSADEPVFAGEPIAVGAWTITLNFDGSLGSIRDASGALRGSGALGAYRFQTFDENDEARWVREYCRDLDSTAFWAVPDQSKPGMQIAADLPATVFAPAISHASVRRGSDADTLRVSLRLPVEAYEHWGAARVTTLTYCFPHEPGPIGVALDLVGRDASRLPEASWLSFSPVRDDAQWRLRKLGALVDPLDVVTGGNQRLHAVSEVVDATGGFTLTTLDAPLVSVGERALYRFPRTAPVIGGGFHVNLYNNMWGTNFPMWFDDDRRYRFTLDLETDPHVA